MTPRKIVIIGPESTGKSTLSAALAAHFNAPWNQEYAREYLEKLNRPYKASDLLTIAQIQVQREQAALTASPKYLFCDTDCYVLKVWSEARYGCCDLKILNEIATNKYQLYLLTDIDLPWVFDPLREHPAKQDRVYFFKQYLDIVQNSGVPWVRISGDHHQRLNAAIDAVQTLL